MTQKYYGKRKATAKNFRQFLKTDIEKLWDMNGFMHCTHMNLILRNLLITSGLFHPKDIVSKWTVIWMFSPHQYLEVRVEKNRKINIELWGENYNIPFGNYTNGFRGGGTIKPKKH